MVSRFYKNKFLGSYCSIEKAVAIHKYVNNLYLFTQTLCRHRIIKFSTVKVYIKNKCRKLRK